MKRQYRVRWQRAGFSKRQKVFGLRESAERYALILQGRLEAAWPDRDPDAFVCCAGSWDCGCGGMTWADEWARQRDQRREVPRLVWGPVIDSRAVGEWEQPDAVATVVWAPESAEVVVPDDWFGLVPTRTPDVPEDDVPF